MATTSSRLLTLLSLLTARPTWSGQELGDRLGMSTRTLRRDMQSLRDLGYPVDAVKGPQGGYHLGAGGKLPPLLLDDDQAIAVAVALQTAPASVAGIDDAVARALTSIKGVMPTHLRTQVEAMQLTALRNWWEFGAPPIAADTLRAVGYTVRNSHLLCFDHLTPDGRRPDPNEPGFEPPLRVEPHHLAVWAGRWYLVAHTPARGTWDVFRVDRIHPLAPTGVRFERRELPDPDVMRYVQTRHHRGDTPAEWPCLGVVLMELPASVVAQWIPGGSVVEQVSPGRCRVTLGAWSWAGIAGLLATFDADITVVEPDELRAACRTIARRYGEAGDMTASASRTAESLP